MPSIICFGWDHSYLFITRLFKLPLILFFAGTVAQWRSNEGNFPSLSSEEKNLLEKFGLSELHDFVRGRGKGTVSRLSFLGSDPKNLPDLELTSSEDEEEREGELTEIGTAPPNLFQVVMPSNAKGIGKKKDEVKEGKGKLIEENAAIPKKDQGARAEPGPEDYEKLAKILQKFLSQRKTAAINENGKKERGKGEGNNVFTKFPSTPQTEGIIPPKGTSTTLSSPSILVEMGKSTVVEQNPREGDGAILTLLTGTRKKISREELSHEILPSELERVSWSGSVQKVIQENHENKLAANTAAGMDSLQPSFTSIRPKILGKVLIQPSRLDSENLVKGGRNKVERLDAKPMPFSYDVIQQSMEPKKGKAYVSVLREGLARQSDQDQDYTFVATITLIRDQGKVILVDTGLATDINGRTDLIEKLGRLNIAPPAVNFVVTTHGHADHSGNTNDFPDAFHFQGTIVHHRTKFNFSNLFESDNHQLTENVELIRIPGHTPEDIGVIVSNTDRYGKVIVAGDIFLAAEDMDFPMMWRPLAWNETAQEDSRRRVLCLADFVVPGHGKVFRVTDEMRARVVCDHRNWKRTRNE